MAEIGQVEDCWEQVTSVVGEDILPVTYMNSAASLKALVGREGGAVCTSSNARAVLDWAFRLRPRVLFFPDQHLGRNTGYRMGTRASCSGRATAPSTTASPPTWWTAAGPRSPA
jgi:quinolinate synthase